MYVYFGVLMGHFVKLNAIMKSLSSTI